MEFAKTKSPPLPKQMRFGESDEDVLNLLLDPDIVTETFLVEMDARGRHVFETRMAGLRRQLQDQGLLPKPDSEVLAMAKGAQRKTGTGKAGARASKRRAAGQANEADQFKVAEAVVRQFESMLPSESDSIPLAQAQEMNYMAESLARVILSWDMTVKGQPALITEPLMLPNPKSKPERELDPVMAPCCAAAESDCRHPSSFIRSWSYNFLSRMFAYCCFEAHQEDTKKNETPSDVSS